MGKNILKYKSNFLYCIIILTVLSLIVMFYSGVKEDYFNIFLLFYICAPLLLIIKPKNNLKIDFIFAVTIVLIITLYAIVFWKYKDGGLLNLTDISQIPEEARSQFSFENELNLNLLFTCSSISTLTSLIIRVIFSKLRLVRV